MHNAIPALALCFFLVTSICAADETLSVTGPLELLDADTFEIGPVVIRIHGIDAPELAQECATGIGTSWPCGAVALARLRALVSPGDLDCDPLSRDPYGRIISVCYVDGVDIGAVLIEEGLAWAYVEYSRDYVELEAVAKDAGKGVWQAPTQLPWDWRDDVWARAKKEHGECPIKGNVSANGDRIYHTPFSPYYNRIDMDADLDRRWFCNEAAALDAGWRAPHR